MCNDLLQIKNFSAMQVHASAMRVKFGIVQHCTFVFGYVACLYATCDTLRCAPLHTLPFCINYELVLSDLCGKLIVVFHIYAFAYQN